MSLEDILLSFASVVAEEASRNDAFRARLEEVFCLMAQKPSQAPAEKAANKRKKGRRSPAVLDPVDLARRGEAELRTKLAALDIDLLLDIVAEYAMDPKKLVMKWKDRERIIARIVEISMSRATKGDAFRAD